MTKRRKSLLLRLGMAMAGITTLALIGMLSSVLIARTLDGFAAAINQAGTLRMQSYRIASSLIHAERESERRARITTEQLVEEYNQRLLSPRIHNVLDKGASDRVTQAYLAVEQHWQSQMEPPLQAYIAAQKQPFDKPDTEQQRAFYLAHVDRFVEDIHFFVKMLELDAEEKTQQLHLIQLISLVLTL
ncbi:MAG: type IV pili methyl-accepting chemotaxis transducer N-terminal domain-containing protein, partial [Gammaproteobacteria bacterium]|nr:type IV pili methyl-accepting chemotaxis transducer N-terminal domain-containing protein [Gammaproteobacteria bacterium]